MTNVSANSRTGTRLQNGASRAAAFGCLVTFGLTLAGCAQQPQEQAGGVRRDPNTREYFAQGRYGTASPRVVGDGQVVPRGGGRAMVGKPYSIAGKRYFPREYQAGSSQSGRASWYGDAFHGRKTANGEIYDMSAVSAAHPTMPLPSYARVTNIKNGRSIVVRVNDRGPYHGGRVIDLSKRVADALDFRRFGTADVKVDYLRPAGVAGSDDRLLMASLRTDGSPANLDGSSGPVRTMFAAATPAPAPEPAAPRTPEPQPQQSPALAIAPPQRPTQTPLTPAFQPQPVVETEENITQVSRSGRGPSPVAPLPPSRPLDLATIPGAAVPISAPRRQATSATFFAPFSADTVNGRRLEKRGPFQNLNADGLIPLRR